MRGLPSRDGPKLFRNMVVLFSAVANNSLGFWTVILHDFGGSQKNILADNLEDIFQFIAVWIVISYQKMCHFIPFLNQPDFSQYG